MPLSISTPDIIRIGLNEGLKETVVKLFSVLASGQLDEASSARFAKGLIKAVEAYEEAVRIARGEV